MYLRLKIIQHKNYKPFSFYLQTKLDKKYADPIKI